MTHAEDRDGAPAPFAMRPVILILVSTVAVGICVLALVRFGWKRETCRCTGNPEAVRVAQRVAAVAGGLDAWKSMRAFAWRAPDGSRLVYAQYLRGEFLETFQLERGPAHVERQGLDWDAYHFDVEDWPTKGAVREELGEELLPLLDRNFVIATLPFRLCDEAVRVELIATSDASSILRVTGPRFAAAGLDGCELSIRKQDDTITSLSHTAPESTVIHFTRWDHIGDIAFPVVKGFDDAEHRAEVFDHEFKAPFILGRD